jgi:ABC-type spermidine/putrescine transport system permease subunit I
MKKLVLAAALSAFAAPAFAGGKDQVVMEPPVIVEETTQASTGAGIIIPLVLIAMVAAIAD